MFETCRFFYFFIFFIRIIQVIIHAPQVRVQGGQQCIPAVVSCAGALGRLCPTQRRGEGAEALLGGRWKGGGGLE